MIELPLILQFEESTAEGVLRLVSFVVGLAIIIRTFIWAVQVMMIQGSEPPPLARMIFMTCRAILQVTGRFFTNPKTRNRYWAMFMPISLLAVLFTATVCVTIGFVFVIFGVSDLGLQESLIASISSMSTLGFAGAPLHTPTAIVYAIEGLTNLFFIGILIVYVNSIFDDYNSRRARIRKMDALIDRARTGPELLENAGSTHGIEMLTPIFGDWAADFIQLKRHHASLEGYLSVYSLDAEHHWTVDAPVVLDAANLRNTLIELPPDPQAIRCLHHGPEAIEKVVDHFKGRTFSRGLDQPAREITRDDFESAADSLAQLGIPIRANRDAAWAAFEAERAIYEPTLTALRNLLDLDQIAWHTPD